MCRAEACQAVGADRPGGARPGAPRHPARRDHRRRRRLARPGVLLGELRARSVGDDRRHRARARRPPRLEALLAETNLAPEHIADRARVAEGTRATSSCTYPATRRRGRSAPTRLRSRSKPRPGHVGSRCGSCAPEPAACCGSSHSSRSRRPTAGSRTGPSHRPTSRRCSRPASSTAPRIRSGSVRPTRSRPWPASSGSPSPGSGSIDPLSADDYEATGGLAGLRRALTMTPGEICDELVGVGPARARRRRVPRGDQVADRCRRATGRAVRLLQRRRGRQRHVRRPHVDGGRSVPADRGDAHRRAHDRSTRGVRLRPLRVPGRDW